MKHICNLVAAALMVELCSTCPLHALPLVWRADWPDAKPVETLVHRGTDVELQPTWFINKTAADTNGWTFSTFCQTNAVGPWFGPLPGAFFSHTNDVGAAFYNIMVRAQMPGGAVNYTAFARLRMLDSPGFVPGVLPLPAKSINFADVEVFNAPYYTKAETEAKIVELAPAPDYSTNNTALVETIHQTEVDPTVPAWAKKTIDAFYSDNLYSLMNRDFYANDSSIKSQYSIWLKGDPQPTVTVGRDKLSDKTFPYTRQNVLGFSAYEGFDYYAHYRPRGIYIWPWWNEDAEDNIAYLFPTNGNGGTFALTSDFSTNNTALVETIEATAPASGNYAAVSNAAVHAAITNALQDAELESHASQLSQLSQSLDGKVPTSRTVNGKALTSNISLSASEVGAATAEDVYRIVAGTNVLLIVTNYNSAVHAPLMSLQHLDPDTGEYVVYWNESRRHGITLTNAMEHADAAVAAERERADAAYAPRAWSHTTSGLGAEAPVGVTWISTPETVIAGGYEYEKVVTSAGAVWVLASNGLTAGATTNGYFRIEASDGTELFSIEKTDSYLVGVPADGIARSGNTVTIPLNVVAPSHPYIRAATNIVNAAWVKEDENGFACDFASVSWSGSSGAYVATVTCAEPQAFFYFEFLHEGTSKIRNSAATEMTGGIYFNGTTYMPTVSGNELKFIRQ